MVTLQISRTWRPIYSVILAPFTRGVISVISRQLWHGREIGREALTRGASRFDPVMVMVARDSFRTSYQLSPPPNPTPSISSNRIEAHRSIGSGPKLYSEIQTSSWEVLPLFHPRCLTFPVQSLVSYGKPLTVGHDPLGPTSLFQSETSLISGCATPVRVQSQSIPPRARNSIAQPMRSETQNRSP